MSALVLAAVLVTVTILSCLITVAVHALHPHGRHVRQTVEDTETLAAVATWADDDHRRWPPVAVRAREWAAEALRLAARTRAERDDREARTGRPWRDDTGSFTKITAGDQ